MRLDELIAGSAIVAVKVFVKLEVLRVGEEFRVRRTGTGAADVSEDGVRETIRGGGGGGGVPPPPFFCFLASFSYICLFINIFISFSIKN